MKNKLLLFSVLSVLASATGASAQSLLDIQGLFGHQQQNRVQDNAVKVEYDIDFQYFFDLRSFDASDGIFMSSQTYNVARFSPAAMLRFDQDRQTTHRLALGVDLTKDLGVNPTSSATYSDTEHEASQSNFNLIKEIFFYYNYRKSIGDGLLDFYAGIHPRTVLDGEYTRAIFADDIRYYDPNLEGLTFKYSAPRFKAEITADISGIRGVDRVGCEMLFTSGAYRLLDWASLGWSASYTHTNGSLLAGADADFALANPYAKVDLGPAVGMKELSLKAGPIASYQLDYRIPIISEGEETKDNPHFPMGVEAIFSVRHWSLGLEDTFYYGDNQQVYRSSAYANTSAPTYAGTLYSGETFYFTRRGFPAWYNRLELYWQPISTGFVTARFSATGHFIKPAGQDDSRIGPFIGSQLKATLLFDLDSFRHPRENGQAARSRRAARTTQRTDGPVLSL